MANSTPTARYGPPCTPPETDQACRLTVPLTLTMAPACRLQTTLLTQTLRVYHGCGSHCLQRLQGSASRDSPHGASLPAEKHEQQGIFTACQTKTQADAGGSALAVQVVDNWANFQQYGLGPPVGLLRADAHLPPLRECSQGFLDAIVCDPPYGVRAGGRRSISGAENGVLSKAGHKGLEVRGATGKTWL